jgi:hypothetical protein
LVSYRRFMTRAQRFRAVCNALAALFLIVAVGRLATAALPLVDPILSTASFTCGPPCRIETDPVLLLEPQAARKAAWQTPGAAKSIAAHARLPKTRAMLFASELVSTLPFFVLFLGLALAMRSFGRSGFNLGALRWLRRSAVASVVLALVQPVAESIHWTAFSRVTHGSEVTQLVFSSGELIAGILLSGAVWVCVWVLDQALALKTDLEEYV